MNISCCFSPNDLENFRLHNKYLSNYLNEQKYEKREIMENKDWLKKFSDKRFMLKLENAKITERTFSIQKTILFMTFYILMRFELCKGIKIYKMSHLRLYVNGYTIYLFP